MPVTDVDIRRAAMDLLARREHGSEELKQKLYRRFNKLDKINDRDNASANSDFNNLFAEDEKSDPQLPLDERIEMAVIRLNEEGLQSDQRLAEAFVRSRANRGQGPMKIKAELRQKGISDAEIQVAMEEAGQDWFALAAEVAAKKFREPPQDPKEKAKRSRFLQQRGFSFDHISAVDDF